MRYRAAACAIVIGVGVMVGCGGGTTSEDASSETPPTESNAGTSSDPSASAGGSAATPAPTSVTDVTELFPPGEGRDQVLANCASCHNLGCSAIGQRTQGRWMGLQESHRDRLPEEDLKVAFAYLMATFNDTKPEPFVPPAFLEGGCTPPG